jgi:hypothetical protein
MSIQQFTASLDVPYLVHFTRASNLPSILTHGLYPRSRTGEVGARPEVNDQHRLDGHLDSTSVSIAFPNCQMFFKYRMENPNVEWAVLALDPSILWLKDCAFCRYNAADARISRQNINNLKTLQSLQGMYLPDADLQSREDQCLRAYDPTDVQAEVLVFDVIEPALIFGIAFDSETVKNQYAEVLGNRQVKVYSKNKSYFAQRTYSRKYE